MDVWQIGRKEDRLFFDEFAREKSRGKSGSSAQLRVRLVPR